MSLIGSIVKYVSPTRGTTYGVVESYDDKSVAKGKVAVSHAVFPHAEVVPQDGLTKVPYVLGSPSFYRRDLGISWGIDEYHDYVALQQLLHELRASKNESGKIEVGDLFAVGVADGAAHYCVTKVFKRTCRVEWRGFCLDRWHDHHFGWGGTFPIADIERYVDKDNEAREAHSRSHQRIEATKAAFGELVKDFADRFGEAPPDIVGDTLAAELL